MQNAYQNATKISLNIDLKAPDIVVPIDSQSKEALLLDLGHITILNRFIQLNIKNQFGNSAMLDELSLKLTHLTLVRIDTSKNDKVVSTLLDPISFTVSVKRNLSTTWYTSVADVDISGKIDAIKV